MGHTVQDVLNTYIGHTEQDVQNTYLVQISRASPATQWIFFKSY